MSDLSHDITHVSWIHCNANFLSLELVQHINVQVHSLLRTFCILVEMIKSLVTFTSINTTMELEWCKNSKSDTNRVDCCPGPDGFWFWADRTNYRFVPSGNYGLISCDPTSKPHNCWIHLQCVQIYDSDAQHLVMACNSHQSTSCPNRQRSACSDACWCRHLEACSLSLLQWKWWILQLTRFWPLKGTQRACEPCGIHKNVPHGLIWWPDLRMDWNISHCTVLFWWCEACSSASLWQQTWSNLSRCSRQTEEVATRRHTQIKCLHSGQESSWTQYHWRSERSARSHQWTEQDQSPLQPIYLQFSSTLSVQYAQILWQYLLPLPIAVAHHHPSLILIRMLWLLQNLAHCHLRWQLLLWAMMLVVCWIGWKYSWICAGVWRLCWQMRSILAFFMT